MNYLVVSGFCQRGVIIDCGRIRVCHFYICHFITVLSLCLLRKQSVTSEATLAGCHLNWWKTFIQNCIFYRFIHMILASLFYIDGMCKIIDTHVSVQSFKWKES